MRRGADSGRCPLHREEENDIHKQLKCKEIQIKSNIFLNSTLHLKKNIIQENIYFFPLGHPVGLVYITR